MNMPCLDNTCLSSENTLTQFDIDGFLRDYAIHKASEKALENKKKLETEKAIREGTHAKKLMEYQRQHAHTKTMRQCCTKPIAMKNKKASDTPIVLNVSEYGYSYTGLAMCRNPYCIACARWRAKERGERIHNGMTGANNLGYGVYFVTLTVPRQTEIATARDEIRRRWKLLQNTFQEYRAQGNNVYFAKALDCTFLPQKHNRYHLHLHCIIVLSENLDENTVKDWIVSAWVGYNVQGINAQDVGQDVRKVGNDEKVAKYVAKMGGLALELASQSTKQAKKGNAMTLAQVMDRGYTTIYKEYLSSMYKVKTLEFSKNWRDLEEENTEESEQVKQDAIVIPLRWWVAVKPFMFEFGEKLKYLLIDRLDTLDPFEIHDYMHDFWKQSPDRDLIEIFLYTDF